MHSNFNLIFEFSGKIPPENWGTTSACNAVLFQPCFNSLSSFFPESSTVSEFHAVIFKLFSYVIQKICHQKDRLLHASTQKLKLIDTLLTQQTYRSMQNISISQWIWKMRT
eukprot:Lithocolla_globosa_v1_NODE_4147_length_1500_cov_25.386159.p2 type:complete len:111 gc:universal NODE_4147_length_1500_cov_25.386159:793-1125(+)